jgi:hypothetical protein
MDSADKIATKNRLKYHEPERYLIKIKPLKAGSPQEKNRQTVGKLDLEDQPRPMFPGKNIQYELAQAMT